MALIKGVVRKVHHLVEEMVCDRLTDAVVHAAPYALGLVAVDKVLPLFLHDRLFFLTHGAAHQIRASPGVARQVAHNLHDLLLIDHAAVGRL